MTFKFPLLVRVSDAEGNIVYENTVENMAELASESDSIAQLSVDIRLFFY